MSSFVVVVGIHSAGKSTLGHQLAEITPNAEYVSGGKEKNQILIEQKIKKPLRQLNQQESLILNKALFEKLSKRYAGSDKTVILNMHTTHSNPVAKDSFIRLIPERFARQIQSIILLKVEPIEAIQRRIARGNDPARTSMDFHQVKKEYLAEAMEARFLASKYKIPLLVMPSDMPPKALISKAVSFIGLQRQRLKIQPSKTGGKNLRRATYLRRR